jgi:hypothetical protein
VDKLRISSHCWPKYIASIRPLFLVRSPALRPCRPGRVVVRLVGVADCPKHHRACSELRRTRYNSSEHDVFLSRFCRLCGDSVETWGRCDTCNVAAIANREALQPRDEASPRLYLDPGLGTTAVTNIRDLIDVRAEHRRHHGFEGSRLATFWTKQVNVRELGGRLNLARHQGCPSHRLCA